MSWLRKDFDYMPYGSFHIKADTREIIFLKLATEEQKQRMLAEWPDYVKRMEEKHARGEFDSSDLV